MSAPATAPPLAPRAPLDLTGGRRDDARLLVAWREDGRLVEATMADLPAFLVPGDVLVVNTSATLPAALVADGVGDVTPTPDVEGGLVVHLSTRLDGEDLWVVEPRHRHGAGSTPWFDFPPDRPVLLPGGARLDLIEPYRPDGHVRRTSPQTPAGRPVGPSGPVARRPAPVRLWVARLRLPRPLDEHLERFGRPIRYGRDARPWPLSAYQTVFATVPGSAEMPSAGRGFTPELVTRLVSRGVVIAPIVLHTGVASPEADETPYPERYAVPPATAAAVEHARREGRRVIAVGTTATRAIETVADEEGRVRPGAGWTDLVITPERGVRVVDGLLSGWHDPEASHLLLVEAVAGRELLDQSYERAVACGFAGHEFGDFHLVLGS
ncbi:MAG TPA: S-adenosylmethionine:tRNA ribosyltransferase-isomerase [Acidimicrobiales bacterium]